MGRTLRREAKRLGAACGLAALPLLSACEAPLELDAVDAVTAAPVRRTDAFGAIARTRTRTYVAGGSVILSRTDPGDPWRRERLAANGPVAITDLAACPDGRVVGADFYRAVWTRSPDTEWHRHAVPTQEHLLGVACDAGGVTVVGAFSTLMTSGDLSDWTDASPGEDAILNAVATDDRGALAVGEFGYVARRGADGAWGGDYVLPDEFFAYDVADGPAGLIVTGLGGRVLRSGDGGASWSAVPSEVPAPLYAVAPSGGGALAVGAGGAVVSIDAGAARVLTRVPAPDLRAVMPMGADAALVAGRGYLGTVDLNQDAGRTRDGGAS